ncbi:MAG: hypothetical protein AAFQ89_05105 [Cyanobacteria bacterium J06626_18]
MPGLTDELTLGLTPEFSPQLTPVFHFWRRQDMANVAPAIAFR